MAAVDQPRGESNQRLLVVGVPRDAGRGLRRLARSCWQWLTGVHTLSRTGEERPSKEQALEAMLHEGWACLHVDARRPGVRLPPALRGQLHVALEYARNGHASTADLRIDGTGVAATLDLDRAPVWTFIPWQAVFAVSDPDGRSVLYPEDVPAELRLRLPRAP